MYYFSLSQIFKYLPWCHIMHESMLLQFQLRLSNAAENEKVVHCFSRRNKLKKKLEEEE